VAATRETLQLLADLNGEVDDHIDGVTRDLTAAWAHAWDVLEPGFATGLSNVLAEPGDTVTRRQLFRDPALQGSLGASVRALDALAALAATKATGAARAAAQQGADGQAAIIASQMPPQRPVTEASLGGFAERALAAILARISQRITALTRPLSPDADQAMRRELVRGMQLGLNPRAVARRILQAVEGAFNGGLSRALTISRTEIMSAYREAAAIGQNAQRDVLEGWVWVASLSNRTCFVCWSLHGSKHPLTEPGPQGHVNCRCVRSPELMSWQDLGFDIPEPPSLIPNAQERFASLSRADQLQIMGPARLDLLDRGAVQWGDLARLRDNPGWRPSWAPVPVRDLPRAG